MKLLLDEMLPAAIAEQLRTAGRDVTAVNECPDLRGLADPELFDHACRAAQVLVTYNRDDFLALDRCFRDSGRGHHGIVILNPRRFPQGNQTIGALVTALEAFLRAGPPYPGFVHWLR